MVAATPFTREAGTGPAVVCLHSNASSSNQWRDLLEMLSPRFHAFAPDSYGAGKSIDWSSDRTICLDDEVDFIEPTLRAAGESFFVVAHSYGAAIALKLALKEPGRVRAMVLYEPTLFSLIDAESPPPNSADGIRQAVQASGNAFDQGDYSAAARHFIDYWMGPQSWDKTPDARKAPIAASMLNVRRWGHALFTEPTALEAFEALNMPILYLVGQSSPPSALGVARLLTAVLPRVEVMAFEGLGHMGPLTHPKIVNAAISDFLDRQTDALRS
jgi:pimeloyl-ACP methyl ester carboxylesterase